MATLTVGPGGQYTTIEAAVAASDSGDTIDVSAGTYTNDFIAIYHTLTLEAVGGTVTLVATQQPPNGKAIIDEGGTGVSVGITGFDISGATVPDGNGAAIRYEGGSLTLTNDTIHGNQDGLLANGDPNGTILINRSNFYGNGAGDGYTHSIYVNAIASLTVENSSVTGVSVGHEIKSRAATTIITNDTIADGANGTGSYEIDLPNGGNATITGNYIEKGANAQNPTAISYGEEGNLYASASLTISNNTIVNDETAHQTTVLSNHTTTVATVSNNTFYHWNTIASGPAAVIGNTTSAAEPQAPCFVHGTLIAVADGAVAVERLRAGDLVRTAAGPLRAIRWIGRRSYAGRFLAATPALWPVRIRAGAVGPAVPSRDLLVSPRHALFIDGVLIQAMHLVNGISVCCEGHHRSIDYVHVELDTHDVLLAEDMPAESFLDDDSRHMFHNAWDHDGDAGDATRRCAPLVEQGPALERVRSRLVGRCRHAA